MKFHLLKLNKNINSIKSPLISLFTRTFHLKTTFPKNLIESCFEYYRKDFKIDKILPTIHLNPNPSLFEVKKFNEFLLQYYQHHKASTEIINFRNDLIKFFRSDSKNQSPDILKYFIIEIHGFNHPNSLKSKDRIIHFKALLLSSILRNYNLTRSKEDNYEILGLSENRNDLAHHCDQIGGKKNPDYVAIVPLESDSQADTFFTLNQEIIEQFKEKDNKSFTILSEVYLDFYRQNKSGIEYRYKTDKLFRINQDQSYLIDLTPDILKTSSQTQSRFNNQQIINALNKFKEFCQKIRYTKSTLRVIINHENQLVIFNNNHLLHGRSLIKKNEKRDVFYLPFDQFKETNQFEKKTGDQIKLKDHIEENLSIKKTGSSIRPNSLSAITKHNLIKTLRR